MKKKDLEELKNKNVANLRKTIADLEKEIVNARLQLNQGKVKNVHSLKEKKKNIATAMTILRVKVLSQVESKEAKSGTN